MTKKEVKGTETKENKIKQSISIIQLIQEHYKWIIAVIPILGVVVFNILKFIEYLTATIYFNYYGLDVELYKYHDQNFLYGLCFSIIILFAYVALLYCFKQIRNSFKHKKYLNKVNFSNVCIIFIFNLFLTGMVNSEVNWKIYLINFATFVVMEYIMSHFVFPNNEAESKEENLEFKGIIIDFIKSLPFILILLIFCHWFRVYSSLSLNKEYRIIDYNKVIVYSNNDYYLTLDCEINNNDLIIYKGTQDKIENMNIYSKLKKFDKVKLK